MTRQFVSTRGKPSSDRQQNTISMLRAEVGVGSARAISRSLFAEWNGMPIDVFGSPRVPVASLTSYDASRLIDALLAEARRPKAA